MVDKNKGMRGSEVKANDVNKGMRGSGGPERRKKEQQLKDAKARQAAANKAAKAKQAADNKEPESYGYRTYDIGKGPEEKEPESYGYRTYDIQEKAKGGTVRMKSGGPVVDSYDYS